MLIELGACLLEISRELKWAGSQIYKRITTNLGRYTHIHAIRQSRETMDTYTRIKQHILDTKKNYTVLGHFVMLLMEQKRFCFPTRSDSGIQTLFQVLVVHTGTLCHFYQSSFDTFELSKPVKSFSVYFSQKVLELSPGIGTAGEVRFELAMCLLLGWIIVYFCVWKGIKSAGKVSLLFHLFISLIKLHSMLLIAGYFFICHCNRTYNN